MIVNPEEPLIILVEANLLFVSLLWIELMYYAVCDSRYKSENLVLIYGSQQHLQKDLTGKLFLALKVCLIAQFDT